MMYGIVAKAIVEAGLKGKAHPSDYLNFFCLGNREVPRQGDYVPSDHPQEGTDYSRAQINRRFLIYVHAKLMIGQYSPHLSKFKCNFLQCTFPVIIIISVFCLTIVT